MATQTGYSAEQSASVSQVSLHELPMYPAPHTLEPSGRFAQNVQLSGQVAAHVAQVPSLHAGVGPVAQVQVTVPPHPFGVGPHALPRLAHVWQHDPPRHVPPSHVAPSGAVTHLRRRFFFLQILHGPHPPLQRFLPASALDTPSPSAVPRARAVRRLEDRAMRRERRSIWLASNVVRLGFRR